MSTSASLTMLKPLTVWVKANCGKFLKELGISDHLTCLLRNLYAGQEAVVRTRHGTMDWFKIGKGVHWGCILSPWLFNFYADYIMQDTSLDESQARIKISRRNNQQPQICRWHHPNGRKWRGTFSRGTKEPLEKVKEESEKAGLKLNIQKINIMASSPITSWQIDGETVETVTDYFLGLQNHCRWWLQPWN